MSPGMVRLPSETQENFSPSHAARGHAVTDHAITLMKSRRRVAFHTARDRIIVGLLYADQIRKL
jgi:hypothetical protein